MEKTGEIRNEKAFRKPADLYQHKTKINRPKMQEGMRSILSSITIIIKQESNIANKTDII